MLPGATEAEDPAARVVNAVPEGEIQPALAVHLEAVVQRRQHRRGIGEIRPRQAVDAQQVHHRGRQQRRADAVAGHIEQPDGESMLIQPAIAEPIAADIGRGHEAPIGPHRPVRDRRRQQRGDIAAGTGEVLLRLLAAREFRGAAAAIDQGERPERQPRAGAQAHRALGALAIDDGAVGRAKVGDDRGFALKHDDAMAARDIARVAAPAPTARRARWSAVRGRS